MQTLTLVQFGKLCSVIKVTHTKNPTEPYYLIITNEHLLSLDERGLIKDGIHH